MSEEKEAEEVLCITMGQNLSLHLGTERKQLVFGKRFQQFGASRCIF